MSKTVYVLDTELDSYVAGLLSDIGHEDLDPLTPEDITVINLSGNLRGIRLKVFFQYKNRPTLKGVHFAELAAGHARFELGVRIEDGCEGVDETDPRLNCYVSIMATLQRYKDSLSQALAASTSTSEVTIKAKRYEHCLVRNKS